MGCKYTITTNDVKSIKPEELQNMDKNALVVVNRIRLNSKLVEYEIKNLNSTETIEIREVLNVVARNEQDTKCSSIRVKLPVSSILKVFPEYKTLPLNSFALEIE